MGSPPRDSGTKSLAGGSGGRRQTPPRRSPARARIRPQETRSRLPADRRVGGGEGGAAPSRTAAFSTTNATRCMVGGRGVRARAQDRAVAERRDPTSSPAGAPFTCSPSKPRRRRRPWGGGVDGAKFPSAAPLSPPRGGPAWMPGSPRERQLVAGARPRRSLPAPSPSKKEALTTLVGGRVHRAGDPGCPPEPPLWTEALAWGWATASPSCPRAFQRGGGIAMTAGTSAGIRAPARHRLRSPLRRHRRGEAAGPAAGDDGGRPRPRPRNGGP